MGLNIGFSSCMRGSCNCCDLPSAPKKGDTVSLADAVRTVTAPNPNPRNFEYKKVERVGEFIVAMVNYPDCDNYEGNKILVLECSYEDLLNCEELDPHFCDGSHISPIARFEPTHRGWTMALQFADMQNQDE